MYSGNRCWGHIAVDVFEVRTDCMLEAEMLVSHIAQEFGEHCKVEALVLGYRVAVPVVHSAGFVAVGIVPAVDTGAVEDQIGLGMPGAFAVLETAEQVELEMHWSR